MVNPAEPLHTRGVEPSYTPSIETGRQNSIKGLENARNRLIENKNRLNEGEMRIQPFPDEEMKILPHDEEMKILPHDEEMKTLPYEEEEMFILPIDEMKSLPIDLKNQGLNRLDRAIDQITKLIEKAKISNPSELKEIDGEKIKIIKQCKDELIQIKKNLPGPFGM